MNVGSRVCAQDVMAVPRSYALSNTQWLFHSHLSALFETSRFSAEIPDVQGIRAAEKHKDAGCGGRCIRRI